MSHFDDFVQAATGGHVVASLTPDLADWQVYGTALGPIDGRFLVREVIGQQVAGGWRFEGDLILIAGDQRHRTWVPAPLNVIGSLAVSTMTGESVSVYGPLVIARELGGQLFSGLPAPAMREIAGVLTRCHEVSLAPRSEWVKGA